MSKRGEKSGEKSGENPGESTDVKPDSKTPAADEPKPKFSLLTLVFLAGIAGVGLSHVQTSYRYERLQQEVDHLKQLQIRLVDTDIPDELKTGLGKLENVQRLVDLTELSEAEISSRLKQAGVEPDAFVARLKDQMRAWQVRFRD